MLAAAVACVGGAAHALGNGSGDGAEAASATGAGGAMSRADLTFAREAAIGGMAEVELGKLAQQNGQSEQVRQFGAQMVQDHTKANDELKQIASMKQIELPMSLDAKHQKDVAKFGKLKGADFDRQYMRDMVADHRKDVADFRKAASTARDSDLKTFASRTLPTLEQHLQMAEAGAGAARGMK